MRSARNRRNAPVNRGKVGPQPTTYPQLLYPTQVHHAEAFAKWWARRTGLTYKRMREVLKNTERAEQKKRASQ